MHAPTHRFPQLFQDARLDVDQKEIDLNCAERLTEVLWPLWRDRFDAAMGLARARQKFEWAAAKFLDGRQCEGR